MAEFEVKVVRVDNVVKHDNADTLDVISIGGYRCIANRKEDGTPRYAPGDLVVYIPEGAVIPAWFLDAYGWRDKLSGSGKDRVKAVKLRGVLSQGILHPVKCDKSFLNAGLRSPFYIDGPMKSGAMTAQVVEEGMNVADFLGITKYEPPVPESMRGDLKGFRQYGMPLKFDIENVKKYPNILEIGEEVYITEKLHGTFCQIGYVPGLNDPELFFDGNWYVCSKGLGAQGIVFKNTEKNRDSNVYVKTLLKLQPLLESLVEWTGPSDEPFVLMGEIFGAGVQDLTYGTKEPQFRIFRAYAYDGHKSVWDTLSLDAMQHFTSFIGFDTVPLLYHGPYHPEVLANLTDGKTTLVDGPAVHIREGVVVAPAKPRYLDGFGDVILKSVSADYLLRKDKNATEFA
jgi:RNA ligase (TIGR02306 family)